GCRPDRVTQLGEIVRRDGPTCLLSERVDDVRKRMESGGWDICVVVNERRVVLGVVRSKALTADPDGTVEAVMNPGPATYRPDVPVGGPLRIHRDRALHGNRLGT